jgi:hypothetical protein
MRVVTDQERWVLAVGDVVDELVRVAAHAEAVVVDRLPRAVLLRTTNRRAAELRRRPNAVIRVFESEQAGQRALGLFRS